MFVRIFCVYMYVIVCVCVCVCVVCVYCVCACFKFQKYFHSFLRCLMNLTKNKSRVYFHFLDVKNVACTEMKLYPVCVCVCVCVKKGCNLRPTDSN